VKCYFYLGPAQDDVVEEQNERLAQELAGKVSRLKSVSCCQCFILPKLVIVSNFLFIFSWHLKLNMKQRIKIAF
jgi:hypothetical protein